MPCKVRKMIRIGPGPYPNKYLDKFLLRIMLAKIDTILTSFHVVVDLLSYYASRKIIDHF